MPRTPNHVSTVQRVPIDTPDKSHEDRRRRRESRHNTRSEDEANETEDEEYANFPLQGIDGLSAEELRNLKDAMGILNKLTADAISTLTSRPLQTIKKVDEVNHREEVKRIALLIDRPLEPLFDRETAALYRRSAYATNLQNSGPGSLLASARRRIMRCCRV